MKLYIVSLAAGVLVGVVYSLLHVRSPAPPLVALVGLLGILVGEQAIPVVKQVLAGHTISAACQQAIPPIFGTLPGRSKAPAGEPNSTEGAS